LSALQTAGKGQKEESYYRDLDGADTLALLPHDLPDEEPLDATIQISLPTSLNSAIKDADDLDSPDPESSYDSTSDPSNVEIEESTLLISEDLLNPQKRAGK
jgi:hypothetical protein